MNNTNPKKDTEKENSENIHIVERKPGMNLEDLVKKIRQKTQQVLAEKAKNSN